MSELFKEVMPVNQAEEEVNNWLDLKRVTPSERVEKAGFVNKMVESLQYGYISIDKEGKITHKLVFPLKSPEGEITTAELQYNYRAETGNLQSKTGNLKGIGMAVYIAYASVLTGQITGKLNKLDSEDFKILQAITAFFL